MPRDDDQISLFGAVTTPPVNPRPRITDDDPGPPSPPVPTYQQVRDTKTSKIHDHPLLPPTQVDGPRGGDTYDDTLDRGRLKGQHAAVMRAMSDHEWHTLAWLAAEVGATTPSVSARLRDARKQAYGRRVIDRRRVPGGNGLHEYRLDPDRRAAEPVPDRTLPHVVQLTAELTPSAPYALVVLTCRQCPWTHELPEGSTVQNAHDALARHPRAADPDQ